MNNYEHINILREDNVYDYKNRRRNMNAPKPPLRDHKNYGQTLCQKIDNASVDITSVRQSSGIKTDQLMVIEFVANEALNAQAVELLSKFELSVVEERKSDNSNLKLIAQFDNKNAIENFNKEILLWKDDLQENHVLTVSQRNTLFSCIEDIRKVSRQDRLGSQLKQFLNNSKSITGFFIVNIDVWFSNDSKQIMFIQNMINNGLGTNGGKLLGDLFVTNGLLLGKAQVNEFSLNVLLEMDIISFVDLPLSTMEIEPTLLYNLRNNYVPIVSNNLDNNAPCAAVLDTGIFSGNPLLKNLIIAEEDFDKTESTPTDMNGHGTGVAGIVAYGDFSTLDEQTVFTPKVRLLNGKIMHDKEGEPCFRDDIRPEEIVKNAILYFYKEYGCRIFNLSVGNRYDILSEEKQFPWANVLDDLARELDIVIVISAGNVSQPKQPNVISRDALMINTRDRLFSPEHKLINPSTAALCISVGSISRYGDTLPPRQYQSVTVSCGPCNSPSAFTRIGFGVNKAIKPDFFEYGGNFSVKQISNTIDWNRMDRSMMENTLSNKIGNIFCGYCGTSFSAPHVTHAAALIEKSLEVQLGTRPSANLIRAFLANSASCTQEMVEWCESSNDSYYKGKDNPKHDRLLRLLGYGRISNLLTNSADNSVTMFAEDKIILRSFHLYKIPVPEAFVNVKANKKITISLAYNPPTDKNRKDYLANTLWFEVFRRIDESELIKYKAKLEGGYDDSFPAKYKASFTPGADTLKRSTLQQSIWQKGKNGGKDLFSENDDTSFLYILVSGKEKFKHPEQHQPQSYALCITYSYDNEENIDLYNCLKNNVKLNTKVQIPIAVRV